MSKQKVKRFINKKTHPGRTVKKTEVRTLKPLKRGKRGKYLRGMRKLKSYKQKGR